jgi:hypothetical protein
MSQTRITLNPQIVPLAEELLQLTGVTSLSNLFALLLTRYGQHLKNSWVIGINLTAAASMQPASMQPASMQSASMQPKQYELPPSPEPLELPQTEDPVILRMARLIEEF